MKRYIKSSDSYSIPKLIINIEICSLSIIRASHNLPQVVDSNGNIIDNEEYEKYEDFAKRVEEYIQSLPVENFRTNKSAKSASHYYHFTIVDKTNTTPIIDVEWHIRLSDHVNSDKKMRRHNTITVDYQYEDDNYKKSYNQTYITTQWRTYDLCMRKIQNDLEFALTILTENNEI